MTTLSTSEPRPADSSRRLLQVVGVVLLGIWVLWWADALAHLSLRGASLMWFGVPYFGADFTTQPDWAVRFWDTGDSPYDTNAQVFHYPPIVIHLFRWVLFFDSATALRIWVVALAVTSVLGAWVAWRSRAALGLDRLPFSFSLALVLFSFPVLFTLERSNFDLITLASMLVATAIIARRDPWYDPAAGGILAIGPWVKIYPGLLGVALIALRRWRVLAGFVVGGVLIGLAEPGELYKSYRILRKVIVFQSTREVLDFRNFSPWSHSVSTLVRKVVREIQEITGSPVSQLFPSSVVALVLLAPVIWWVARRAYRCRQPDALAFPLSCWVVAAASFVPEIANDYNFVFLPLAALGAWSTRDGWAIHGCLLVGALALQPIALPINGFVLLFMKLGALLGVAGSIVRRAADLDAAAVAPARAT